jgi:hypothetical protein
MWKTGMAALALAALLTAGTAGAAEIAVGEAAARAGETVKIPVRARGIENLAGVKLVMTYDAGKLAFEAADKTPLTTSLMHIVNSKKAGRLIVVMAGARGVSAKDGVILDLRFRVPDGETAANTTRIQLREVQVMSDQLKEIAAEGKDGDVQLNGPATAKAGADEDVGESPGEAAAEGAETEPAAPGKAARP